MRFGVAVTGEHVPARLIELVRLIEESGFDQVWMPDERFHRDVFVNMTLTACNTDAIRIGCMVTDPFVRHPALTAVAAATVDELSGNRCTFGFGAGISGFAEMELERIRPARAIKEAVGLIHALSRGDQAITLEGDIIRFKDGQLDFTPPRPIQIFVCGRGPRVLEVAGEVGDGAVIGSFCSQAGIRYGLDHIARGAARVGRDAATIPKVSWLYTSVSADGAAARDAVRVGVAVAMCGSRNILEKIGVTLPADVLAFMDERGYRFERKQLTELGALLPDDMLDQFSLAGTPEEVTEKLIRVGRLGIGHAAMWPFPAKGMSLDETIRLLAKEVVPAVQAELGA
jgi:5,10-methylenetetrahydromethanopterin reductase